MKFIAGLLALSFLLSFASFGCFGKECTKVKCETSDKNGIEMQYFSGHVIANHTIVGSSNYSEMTEAKEYECVEECIKNQTCITILVSEPKCWLYAGDDVYANPERIQKKEGYKIISLGNGICRSQPCQFGKCIPDYETGKYTCKCRSGYVGEKCDQLQGPVAHFSFDNGTIDPAATLTEVQLSLDKGRLLRSPERRGKVLVVGSSQDALTVTTDGPAGPDGVDWLANFFKSEKNSTVTLWIKTDGKIVTDVDRKILYTWRWSMRYNGAEKKMKWFIATTGDKEGENFILECDVTEIRRWNYFVFAGSGVTDVAKLYVNGELCAQKQFDREALTPETYVAFGHLSILKANEGTTLLDELKFFKSFPISDEHVRESYNKEKKELMS